MRVQHLLHQDMNIYEINNTNAPYLPRLKYSFRLFMNKNIPKLLNENPGCSIGYWSHDLSYYFNVYIKCFLL